MKAYIYARVSTEEQAKEGQSIETQLKLCRKYADDNGIEVMNTFVDEGKSATNMNRPALQDMLEACQGGSDGVSIILVQDTDRLARNTLDHLQIKALLKKKRIKLISVSQPIIDDSPEGDLVDTLLAATNAFQSRITGRKTSKVLEQKALMGWFPGGIPPLGYRNADNPNFTSTLDKRIIVIDESVAPVIRDMFARYATGEYSTSQLTDHLNEMGVKSPKRGKIHTSLTVRTLQNPFYIGQFVWNKKLYTNAKHPPLIDEQIFERVKEVMRSHNQNVTRKRKHDMLLRGFLFYVDDGKQMWGEPRLKDGKEYRYYYSKQTGKGSYVSADVIENQVQKYVASIEISEEYRKKVLEMAKQILADTRDSREEERKRLEREKQKYLKALSDAEDDRYIHHNITSETLTSLINKYQPLIKKVQQELEQLEVDHTERMAVLEKVLRLAENIGESYQTATPEIKREYLQLFFRRFWVKDGRVVEYELTPDLKELIEAGSVRVSSTGLPG